MPTITTNEGTDLAPRGGPYSGLPNKLVQAANGVGCAWGIPDHSLLELLSALEMPVFVANGDSDPMIRPYYSYLPAGLLPQAQLQICSDSAHGFLFQYHAEFAAAVTDFLS